jgi:hypothetical protein
MKVQRLVRTNVILMGLGAMLLLATSVRAQQDMDPTDFAINPGTPHVEKVAARTTVAPAAAKEETSDGTTLGFLWSGRATQQEAALERMTILDEMMAVILVSGIGMIVAYATIATRRERRLPKVSASGHYRPASGATAH